MKIGIAGYGKMGHEIEAILLDRGHEITLRSTSHTPFKAADLAGTDVVIEFTRPEVAVDNIFKCFEANVPVVVGTTGWYGRMPEVRHACESGGNGLFYASNFSIGVNILFEMNRQLARIMRDFEEYEPGILEIHHTAKLDKPSGTAITLAEGIMENITRKKKWVNNLAELPDELTIISQRQGEVPGTHVINYTSAVDNVSLVHEAVNRKGFAAGAIRAAEFIHGKRGIFTMQDLLKF